METNDNTSLLSEAMMDFIIHERAKLNRNRRIMKCVADRLAAESGHDMTRDERRGLCDWAVKELRAGLTAP